MPFLLAGRIEVSRAFGDRAFKKQGMSAVPDVQAFQISARDAFLLLACDGFWGAARPAAPCAFLGSSAACAVQECRQPGAGLWSQAGVGMTLPKAS